MAKLVGYPYPGNPSYPQNPLSNLRDDRRCCCVILCWNDLQTEIRLASTLDHEPIDHAHNKIPRGNMVISASTTWIPPESPAVVHDIGLLRRPRATMPSWLP